MLSPSSFLLLAVCGVLVLLESAGSSPLADHTLGLPPAPPAKSELRRGAARALVPSLVTSAKSGDYSAAVYAARLANELVNLEKTRNKVYTDFIYSGFSSSEVPLGLPSDLQKLSRTSPAILDASPVGETTTTSSSGSSPDAGLDFVLPGARGRPARPIQDPFTKASEFPAQGFLPRRPHRRTFLRNPKARRFPFARGVVHSLDQ